MNTARKYNPVELIDVECEAHYEAIDPAHLDDPYAQSTLIGPCVVTGEIYHHNETLTVWPDMEVTAC